MTETLPSDDPQTEVSQEMPIVRIGPDGEPLPEPAEPAERADPAEPAKGPRDLTDLVEQPAKVMRIGSMIKQLLEEVREAPLDTASRVQLRQIHERSVAELKDGLAPELVTELERLSLPFVGDEAPSEAELRIAQAQLVGWLEGLFHGIQTAMLAQQMTARAAMVDPQQRAIAQGDSTDPQGPHHGSPQQPSGPYL